VERVERAGHAAPLRLALLLPRGRSILFPLAASFLRLAPEETLVEADFFGGEAVYHEDFGMERRHTTWRWNSAWRWPSTATMARWPSDLGITGAHEFFIIKNYFLIPTDIRYQSFNFLVLVHDSDIKKSYFHITIIVFLTAAGIKNLTKNVLLSSAGRWE
jgi:hypothetical protein